MHYINALFQCFLDFTTRTLTYTHMSNFIPCFIFLLHTLYICVKGLGKAKRHF